MRSRRVETAVLCVALALFAILSLLQTTARREQPSFPSTYDTGARGYAALYEFLQREGVEPARFERPAGQLPAGGMLVIAGDYVMEPIYSAKNSTSLETWVRRGGKLVVLGALFPGTQDALGLPRSRTANDRLARAGCAFTGKVLVSGEFVSAMRRSCNRASAALMVTKNGAVAVLVKRGRGSIVYVVTPTIFDNAHLAGRDNAAFAYDIFSGGAAPRFDEYVYGYEAGKTFWQMLPAPVLAAVALALFGLLLAVIGANLRLSPARHLVREDRRDSFAYIESLARMLQRGGAARDVIARLARAAAALRPPAPGDETGRRAVAELRGLHEQREPGAREVLRAGVIFAWLRKEYEW